MDIRKKVLITGGSSGIGLALARLYASKGCDVFILSRSKQHLSSALDQIQAKKVDAIQNFEIIQADVTDAKSIEDTMAGLILKFGSPDILINSAGIAHPGKFEEISLDVFHSMMDVNFFGSLNTIKALLPSMINRQSGHIVNISSIAGFIGVYGYTAYSASKYAVRGFSDCLRSEMKPLGIKVSIVFPPDTQTPQLEYENRYKPDVTKYISGSAGTTTPDVVAAEVYRGVQKGRYIIIPGTEGKLVYHAANFLGNSIYPIMDILVSRGIKRSKSRL